MIINGTLIGKIPTCEEVGALPITGGTMTGDLTLKGEPTTDNMAANKKYVDNKAGATVLTFTLSSSSWTSSNDVYTQAVTATGVLADETAQEIHLTPKSTDMTSYREAGIYASAQAANSITFTAAAAPTTNITVYAVVRVL